MGEQLSGEGREDFCIATDYESTEGWQQAWGRKMFPRKENRTTFIYKHRRSIIK